MALFTLSSLTVPKDFVKDLGEVILENSINNPALTDLHEITEGIKVATQIVIAKRGGLMISAPVKCGGTMTGDSSVTFPMSEKTWSPVEVGFRLDFCEADFSKVFEYGKKAGVDRDNILEADFFNWLQDYLEENIPHELLRMFWFSDTAIGAITGSPSGNLGDPAYIKYFNKFNGFWKQLIAQATSNAAQRVTIAANTATDQTLTATVAYNTLNSMYKKASIRLRQQKANLKFFVTDSVDMAFREWMRTQSLDKSFEKITIDQGVLYFEGIPLVVVSEWDLAIESYFNDSGTLYLPHRALLTYPANLRIGIEDLATASELRYNYDARDKVAFVDMSARVDAKLILEEEFVVAY